MEIPKTPQRQASAPIEIPVPKKQNGIDRRTHISTNDPLRRRLDFVTDPVRPENNVAPKTPLRSPPAEHDTVTPDAPKKPNGGMIHRVDSNCSVFDTVPPPLVW